jgi:hypothetical protein
MCTTTYLTPLGYCSISDSRLCNHVNADQDGFCLRRGAHDMDCPFEGLHLGTPLGQGVHGRVYRAMYQGEQVAVKVSFTTPLDPCVYVPNAHVLLLSPLSVRLWTLPAVTLPYTEQILTLLVLQNDLLPFLTPTQRWPSFFYVDRQTPTVQPL